MRLMLFMTHPYEVLAWGFAIGFVTTASALLLFIHVKSKGKQ